MAHIIFPKRWTVKPSLGSQIHRGHPLAHDLASFWACNESGGLVAKDLAGINHGAISASVPWVSGKNGSALLFDGVDTHNIQIADTGTLAFTDKVTVAALVRPLATANGIFEKTMAGAINKSYLLYVESSLVKFRIVSASVQSTVISATATSDAWFSVAGTYDGANLSIYVNGILEATSAVTGAIDAGAGVCIIGELGSAVYPFNGRVESVGVWHTALSAADISRLSVEPYAMFVPQSPRVRYFIAPGVSLYRDLVPASGAAGSGFQPVNVAF
jgi:hypothetical protein